MSTTRPFLSAHEPKDSIVWMVHAPCLKRSGFLTIGSSLGYSPELFWGEQDAIAAANRWNQNNPRKPRVGPVRFCGRL